jgi:K(+)-stimulated pyrophosphate-energized sodium pump
MKSCEKGEMMGNCDMSKCATMTKDECAKMCDSLKCTPEQKEMCLSHYDANGKFIAKESKEEKACCAKKGAAEKQVNVQMSKENGKAKATVTISENGKQTVQVFEGTEAEVKAKVEAIK